LYQEAKIRETEKQRCGGKIPAAHSGESASKWWFAAREAGLTQARDIAEAMGGFV